MTAAKERIIKGHVGIGPKVTGPALVAADNFSARYDLDRINGVFSRPAHKLCGERSEEHTSELQSLMRISYAVFCLKKKKTPKINRNHSITRENNTHTK